KLVRLRCRLHSSQFKLHQNFFQMRILSPALHFFLFAILWISGWKKKVLQTNLKLVYPKMRLNEQRKFRKELLWKLSRDASDFITRNTIYSPDDPHFIIDKESIPIIDRMKHGGFLLTAHLGNYEAMGPWLCRLGVPLSASYSQIKPKFLNNWLYSHLRSVDKSEYSLFIHNPRQILSLIDNHRLFCLLADQDYRKSHPTQGTFLGIPVNCNPIPEFILRHRPKTPIYICWLKTDKKVRTLYAKQIFPNSSDKRKNITSLYNIWLSQKIIESKSDWYGWVHRRFLSNFELSKKIYSH
ncbi:MAG: hypothetical protein M0P13_11455, partial [Fibrobacteraceae bacterium]|nr:hypothetical protein [Fibrobacteraceae bacterium]